jgi:tetratricopeptide (TPR) repeat protein
VGSCLQTDPAGRYQDASQLEAALERAGSDGPARTPGKRRASAIAAMVLLSALAWGAWRMLDRREPAGAAPMRLVVLPFAYTGPEEHRYLGDGMRQLIGSRLQGAGTWSVVPVEEGTPSEADAGSPSRRAARAGAALYVTGSLLESNGMMQIQASVRRTDDQRLVSEPASVEGPADQVFDLVDRLAISMLTTAFGTAQEQRGSLLSLRTGSLPALKAFLEGEAQHRTAGSIETVIQAYQRAVELDPAFALAYYKLSIALEYSERSDVSRQVRDAAEKALQHEERLSPRDQLMVRAFVAWRRGKVAEAERLYESMVSAYPADVEAWIQLGEIRLHAGPRFGRDSSHARHAWERVLELDPANTSARTHLARVAAWEGRVEEMQRLMEEDRTLPRETGAWYLSFMAIDPAEQESFLGMLSRATDSSVAANAWEAFTFGRDLDWAERIARVLGDPHRSAEAHAYGRVVLAHLRLARGQWAAALEELSAVGAVDPGHEILHHAHLQLAPFLRPSREELLALRARLQRWDARAERQSDTPSNKLAVHNGAFRHLRLYLAGLISAQLGDEAAALRLADELETLPGILDITELAQDLSRSVRAEAALVRGDRSTALELLDGARLETWYQLAIWSPFYSQTRERFMRARLLEEAGRLEEAARWYASFEQVSLFDIVYLAPARAQLAHLEERAGRRREAGRLYSGFLDLWRDADSALQPDVARARQRLEQLGPRDAEPASVSSR